MDQRNWMLVSARPVKLADCIMHEDSGSWWCYEYQRLKCPVCADTYQHTGELSTIDGGDSYAAGWGGRGSLDVVALEGECGHRWQICFGFHKGETVCFALAALGEDGQPEEQ